MNIAKRWLLAAIRRMYKERGIEPTLFDIKDMVHKPVSMGDYSDELWKHLQEERDRTENQPTNDGQFEE